MSTYTQITCHIVFATKNRMPVLPKDHRKELFKYIYGILKQRQCHTFRINGVEDHIHILTGLHPTISIANLVKDIKTASSGWMKKREEFQRFEYWQEGYGAFTHSKEDRPRLIRYIKDQEEHHKTVSFVDELRELVENAGLEFNEQYLP